MKVAASAVAVAGACVGPIKLHEVRYGRRYLLGGYARHSTDHQDLTNSSMHTMAQY